MVSNLFVTNILIDWEFHCRLSSTHISSFLFHFHSSFFFFSRSSSFFFFFSLLFVARMGINFHHYISFMRVLLSSHVLSSFCHVQFIIIILFFRSIWGLLWVLLGSSSSSVGFFLEFHTCWGVLGYTEWGTRGGGEIEHFQLHTTFYHNFTLFFHCVGTSSELYAVGGVFFS